MDEDFMGIIAKIVSSCCRGTAAPKVVRKAIRKWMQGAAVRLTREASLAS